MAKSTINIGTAANDGTGDSLRSGATKVNGNTDEIYNAIGNGTDLKDIVNSNLELDIPNDETKKIKEPYHWYMIKKMVDRSDYKPATNDYMRWLTSQVQPQQDTTK